MKLTAVLMPVPEGYIAFVEELRGANTQGSTLEEARANLREAVELVLEANREQATRDLAGHVVSKEPFHLAAPSSAVIFIRHLERHGCQLLREGGNHTIYVNSANNRVGTVPKHREISDFLARKICRELGVPAP
jgi:predicted RNase H-like HicB family nuclease/predicted RNA binding protein YcfA (HicA-like mRNA interferase family)